MSRPAAGTITVKTLADGTRAFYLRFPANGRREREVLHERRGCECGCGGGWTDATAQVELENILARVKAGVWRKRDAVGTLTAAHAARRVPTFGEYAQEWLHRKKVGALGAPISTATQQRLRWALSLYLLPSLARVRLDEFDGDLCLRLKTRLLSESHELGEVRAAGVRLRHRNGRVQTALAPASIRKVIDTLAQVLDDAIEDGHLEHNPARGKRMRLRVPKPKRTFLEQDELAALLDAGATLDALPAPVPAPARAQGTRGDVARLAATMRPAAIARELGISKATVSYHLRRLDTVPAGPYHGVRAIVATLGYAGPRVSEACDLRLRNLRVHGAGGAHFAIDDSKTPTGVREVQVSPHLAEILIEHIDRLRRAGMPTGPDAWLFPNEMGNRLTRQRAADLVHAAAVAAGETIERAGLPPLPHVTPHTLRRTYVSIALLASGMDIAWVQAQVGHDDSSMTLDVYKQLMQRHKRDHGQAFDRLIDAARDELVGHVAPDEPLTVPTEWEVADA